MKSNQHLLFNDISFEIRGGEIMAIMSTSEEEGTAVLDLVAGVRNPILGNMILNGQAVRAHNLKSRVAYVQNNSDLCKDMTVLQTLRFHYDLRKPTDKLGYLKIGSMDRVSNFHSRMPVVEIRWNSKRKNTLLFPSLLV